MTQDQYLPKDKVTSGGLPSYLSAMSDVCKHSRGALFHKTAEGYFTH